MYVYASTESIMKTALKRVGLHKTKCIRIKVEEGEIISIDRNGFLSRNEFNVQNDFGFYNKWNIEIGCAEYFDEGYSEHEQMLIDYAKFYGFDEEDIMILLDYGYTANEIEEFLTDTDLFYEALQIALGEDDDSDPDQIGFNLCDICGW